MKVVVVDQFKQLNWQTTLEYSLFFELFHFFLLLLISKQKSSSFLSLNVLAKCMYE